MVSGGKRVEGAWMDEWKGATGLPNCPCNNNEKIKYRPYIYDDQLLGVRCTNSACGQEWLQERFLYHPDEDNTRPSVNVEDVTLKQQLKIVTESNTSFQVKYSRTKIENFQSLCNILKVGDHITWHRPLGYWHHAIVSEIDYAGGSVMVFQWCKSDKNVLLLQITHKWLDLNQEWGELFRIDYPDEITQVNPSELVIARARSRLEDTGYSLFNDNCETFATCCKTGLAESCQVVWLFHKLKAIMFTTTVKAVGTAKEFFAEILEKKSYSLWIAIFVECGFCVYDVYKILNSRNAGDISRHDCMASVAQRLAEAIFGISTGAACSMVGGWLGELLGCTWVGLSGAAQVCKLVNRMKDVISNAVITGGTYGLLGAG
ncbi:uncharacterized protein LOC119720380 [Patiria miniata]|uniref:LRAT domain-containing protein n=1 Tax=Patiria miniata TaxID=46514 RepID=A0A913Z2B4_PATMI|nr:uncharacterized protein LOC119720380 [Patiria miniata]